MYELELFAGAGGGLLAQRLLGHHPVGAIEIDPYCRAVLLQRQRDLCLPVFPVWDDVTTFRKDNPQCADYIGWLRTIAGELCISGGFPCQDISSGGKGKGITGPKSGLWFEMARIIDEIRPRFTFLENSPMLATRGFEMVLASLAGMGLRDGTCWALEISDIRSSASASGFWGSIARNMGRDMTPGTSKAALLRSTYGAQKNSLLCRMLREIDLYPTVSLCELLMDWPDRWSRLEPLAMDRFLRWRRSHGDSSQAA